MQQVALITYKEAGSFTSVSEDENIELLRFLKEKGLSVSFQVWDDAAVDWSQFGLVIMKSPWDYFDKIDAFYAWLDKLEQLNCRVLNPVKTIRWNADKVYFKDLGRKGVNVAPTVWLEAGNAFKPEEVFEALHTKKIIVKPRISGAAKNTFALTLEDAIAKTPELNELIKQEPFMVQPFLPEIEEKGEWSFLFFNGKYSHTVLKTAKAGDFRVQHFFGGTVHTPTPPAHLQQAAQYVVDTFASDCLYARVDGVEVNGEFILMELELIEPFLFLHTSEGAYERYYTALRAQLDQVETHV